MSNSWQKQARTKVYDDMEGIDLEIGNDTEVFLPKKFKDNEIILPNVPKGVAFERSNQDNLGIGHYTLR